jgi:hypothetical protein
LRIKPSLTAILNEKAWTRVQAFLLHVIQIERGEKPRQGSTKWLAAQRDFVRPTGRPQGDGHRFKVAVNVATIKSDNSSSHSV